MSEFRQELIAGHGAAQLCTRQTTASDDEFMANITMSVDQITEIVSKLQKSSNEIESIWNSINSTEIPKIREAWSGKDSEAYISKLKEVDADVQKALKAQRLLASTFEAAKQQVLDAQANVTNKVSSL